VTAVVAAIEAVAVALAGLAVVAIPALLLWVIAFGLAAEPRDVVSAVAGVWLLAHWVPLGFEIDPQSAVALGLAPDPLAFTLSLAPLGLTLLTVFLSARSGWRLGARGGAGSAGVLGGGIGFAAAAFGVASAAGPLLEWPLWGAVLVPASSYLVPSCIAYLVRAAREGHLWWRDAVRWCQRLVDRAGARGSAALPARAAETLRLATAALAVLVGIAALALLIGLIAGYADVVALAQSLQLDPLGSFLVFLLQLVMLPVALLWSLAWMTGAGFSIGAGSSVTPFETLLGPLPSLPLFGAMPHGLGSFGALAPALLVLGGVGLGFAFSRRGALRRTSWTAALTIPLAAAILLGLAATALTALARGSIGPERLATTGAEPWLVGSLAAAELGIGMLLGVTAGRIDVSRAAAALTRLDVSRLRPGRGPGVRAAAGPDARTAEPEAPDEWETVDLTELRADEQAAAFDPEAGVPGADPAPEPGAAPAAEPGADPSAGADPVDPAPEPGADPAPEPGADPAPAAEHPDTDALLRAYAWDGEAGTEPAGDADRGERGRAGWRLRRPRG